MLHSFIGRILGITEHSIFLVLTQRRCRNKSTIRICYDFECKGVHKENRIECSFSRFHYEIFYVCLNMVHSTSFSIARCFQIFNEKEMAYFVDDLFDLHNVREVYDRSIDLGANLFKNYWNVIFMQISFAIDLWWRNPISNANVIKIHSIKVNKQLFLTKISSENKIWFFSAKNYLYAFGSHVYGISLDDSGTTPKIRKKPEDKLEWKVGKEKNGSPNGVK